MNHLLLRAPTTLWKIRERREHIILNEKRGITNDERKKKILHDFWESVLGRKRPYDSDALAQLLEGHSQVNVIPTFRLNIETFKKLFQRKKKSGPGLDGISFTLHQTAFS